MSSDKPILSDDLAYWAAHTADRGPSTGRAPHDAPHLVNSVARAQSLARAPKDLSHQSRDAQILSALPFAR